MAKIIKVHKEQLPALKVIGIKYTNADRDESGGYGQLWHQWMTENKFEALQKMPTIPYIESGVVGFMRHKPDDFKQTFEYWIGMFFADDTVVPEGFDSIHVEAGVIATCWIQGNSDDGSIYKMHDKCLEAMRTNAMSEIRVGADGYVEFFERYNDERFGRVDENGERILDYCVYISE